MFTRWLNFLNSKTIMLASQSAQRQRLLKEIGLNFESVPSDFPENLDKTTPIEYVKLTSEKKFEEFIKNNKNLNFEILITADTIVVHNDIILEKPESEEDIFKWFRNYSNDKIDCYTSVVIGIFEKNELVIKEQFVNKTLVYFDEINDEMIKDYILSKESFGKAGAFSIQGLGKIFIKKIDGCYYNVVGFPVQEFTKTLTRMLVKVYGEYGWKINK